MQEQTFGTLMKVCLTVFGAFFSAMLLLFLITGIIAKFNFGNAVGMVISGFLAFVAFRFGAVSAFVHKLMGTPFGRAAVYAFFTLMTVSVICAAVISAFMIKYMNRLPDRPAAVIVLGCRVKENGPSLMLDKRISAAYEYLEANPDAVCIASGGKGDDEPVSEAECIRQGLISRGISPDRIIMEDKSTNTRGNIRNSLEIMDKLGMERRAVIVTSEFHQLRAAMLCKKAGIESYSISSATLPPLLPAYWIREWLAVVRELLRK